MKTYTPPQIIETLAEHFKVTVSELAQKAGYERAQSFYDVISGKTKNISPKMADKIVAVFPEISKDWLLTGNGSMLIPQIEEVVPEEEDEDDLVLFLRDERKGYDISLIDINEKTRIPVKTLKEVQQGITELSTKQRNALSKYIEEAREYFQDESIGKPVGRPTGYYDPAVDAKAGFDNADLNNEKQRIPVDIPNFADDVIIINV